MQWVPKSEDINPDAGQDEQEPFLTQSERAAIGRRETKVNSDDESDRYEEAGLGPDIRSGAISGAEAEAESAEGCQTQTLRNLRQNSSRLIASA